MQLLMALLCSALVQLTTGATVYRPADSLSQDIQDFRSRIGDGDFDEREAFFDIEVAINRLDDEEVKEVANEFRKDLTLSQHQLETDLFELELLLNTVDDSDRVRQEQLGHSLSTAATLLSGASNTAVSSSLTEPTSTVPLAPSNFTTISRTSGAGLEMATSTRERSVLRHRGRNKPS